MASIVPTPADASKPLRRDAERNRLRILEAAQELFTTRGLDVSLDDIARHAGVGIGTIYRRYPDKQELIKALFEQRIEDFVLQLETAAALNDPWESLTTIMHSMLDRESCDRGLMDLLTRDSGLTKSADVHNRVTLLIEGIIDRAKAAGVVRQEIGTGDFGMIHLMMASVVAATASADPDIWKRTLALVMDGLRPGGTLLPAAAPSPEQVDAAMYVWRTART